MSSKGRPPQSDTAIPALDKQVIRLPDGRELTYYRFPDPPAPAPAAPTRPPQER
jgi:hypothetical protein